MNKTEMALASFRKPYSCAQTVYAAFAPITAQGMDFMRQNSGGNAPENMCGALFAATQVAPENADKIKRIFVEKIGDSRCAVIKRSLNIPCENCVRTACEALEQIQK